MEREKEELAVKIRVGGKVEHNSEKNIHNDIFNLPATAGIIISYAEDILISFKGITSISFEK